jgi:hypothetical protein
MCVCSPARARRATPGAARKPRPGCMPARLVDAAPPLRSPPAAGPRCTASRGLCRLRWLSWHCWRWCPQVPARLVAAAGRPRAHGRHARTRPGLYARTPLRAWRVSAGPRHSCAFVATRGGPDPPSPRPRLLACPPPPPLRSRGAALQEQRVHRQDQLQVQRRLQARNCREAVLQALRRAQMRLRRDDVLLRLGLLHQRALHHKHEGRVPRARRDEEHGRLCQWLAEPEEAAAPRVQPQPRAGDVGGGGHHHLRRRVGCARPGWRWATRPGGREGLGRHKLGLPLAGRRARGAAASRYVCLVKRRPQGGACGPNSELSSSCAWTAPRGRLPALERVPPPPAPPDPCGPS